MFNKCVNEAWGGSSVSLMVGVFKEMHMCVVASFVDHHSLYLRRLWDKEQGFLQAPEKRTCLCWGAEVRIVQSNLRHMECFHGGQKGDLLKDTIKLKNAERRREEERCYPVSGGLLQAEGISRAKDNTNCNPEKVRKENVSHSWLKRWALAVCFFNPMSLSSYSYSNLLIMLRLKMLSPSTLMLFFSAL